MNLIKKLYLFQKQRFPLRILIFTTFSSILSSAAVSPVEPSYLLMILAFVSTMFFLFHIRVIDESRDLELDSSLHPERPVQSGIISLRELALTTFFGIVLCIAIALYSGIPATVVTLLVLLFTTFAWRDFFAKKFFASRPVLYHIVNSPQMVLIQWNIYAIYTDSYSVTLLMVLQLLLVYNSIFILEIVRKVKASSVDSPDTYSARMGTSKAIHFSTAMVFGGYIIYYFILNGLGVVSAINLFMGAIVSTMAIAVMLVHKQRRSTLTEKVMVTGVALYYVFMNLIIYISSI